MLPSSGNSIWFNVTLSEYNQYDFVFFASHRMHDRLKNTITPPSGVLLQCCDPVQICETPHRKSPTLLFVGNSRGEFRDILRDLLPTSYDLQVYGAEWNDYPVKNYVVKELLDHDKLNQAYHDAKIVLNNHWEDMRANGIISNRIFDVLSSGGFVISDYIPEIQEVFNGTVITYKDRDDLNKKIDYYLTHKDERDDLSKRGQSIVLAKHKFSDRISEIIHILETLT